MRRIISIASLVGILASAGAAQAAPNTCAEADNAIGCCDGEVNYYCTNGSNTVGSKTCGGGQVCGWDTQTGEYACVQPPTITDPTGQHPIACGMPTTGGNCGITTGNATCDACINASCCAQSAACSNDPKCVACLNETPVCNNDGVAALLENCVQGRCATQCAPAATTTSSSSSTTASSSSSSSSSGRTTASSTTATSGAGGAGGAAGFIVGSGGSGGFVGVGNGVACSAAPGPGGDGAAWIAALALATLGARRRRAQ